MTEPSSSGFWPFARQSWLLTAAAIGLVVVASLVIMPAWGVIVTWFGFIYFIAVTLALVVLLVIPADSLDALDPARRFGWFAAAGAIAVALTVIYSAVRGALFSGTPTGTVVEIQLFHSALFFGFSLPVAGICAAVQARKAAVQARKAARTHGRQDDSARI